MATMSSTNASEIFSPPINRSMKDLDRSFFHKVIPSSAATITDTRQISHVRTQLSRSKELLQLEGLKPIFENDKSPGVKCIHLKPQVKADDPQTWSPILSKLVDDRVVKVQSHDVKLTYDNWAMHEILEAVLPDLPEDEKETPTGFAQAGHVAHLNLRKPYLPYKYLIGQILLDKNPHLRTVINKTLDVGTESVYRTFPYEVLAGPDDLNVTLSESGCEFKFDFAKVYWNSRLGTEHGRIVSKFQQGEAVCDVMAGVGPFAIPAAKRKVFVRANDLNPDCFSSLQENIQRNKVNSLVSAACMDGRSFIREATKSLSITGRTFEQKPYVSRSGRVPEKSKREALVLQEPASFDHYVMNLPATAVEFLDAFKGTYTGRETEFIPHTTRKLPMIHVYLFQTKKDTSAEEMDEVCQTVSKFLGVEVRRDDTDLEVELFDVRLVAPTKRMYCASFRLPPAVAFATE